MPRKKKKILKVKKKSSSKKRKLQKKPVARKKKILAIPKGYNSITAYLFVGNGVSAIDFYKKVFGAKELMRMERDGKIGHAELKIGDTRIMLADERPEMGDRSPQAFGGSPVGIHLYVKDVDTIMDRALHEGAKMTQAIANQLYGDRNGEIEDPFGHKWTISTHVEDVTPKQMKKRIAEINKQIS